MGVVGVRVGECRSIRMCDLRVDVDQAFQLGPRLQTPYRSGRLPSQQLGDLVHNSFDINEFQLNYLSSSRHPSASVTPVMSQPINPFPPEEGPEDDPNKFMASWNPFEDDKFEEKLKQNDDEDEEEDDPFANAPFGNNHKNSQNDNESKGESKKDVSVRTDISVGTLIELAEDF